MRRVIFYKILVVVFIALSVFGCKNKSEMNGDNSIVVALDGNPTNLDPRYATDAYSSRITPLVYTPLFQLNKNSELEPVLCTEYEQVDDVTYIFKLKKGITFHRGEPFTARDVKYTYEYIMDKDNKSPHFGSFDKIDKIEIIDDYTIKIKLKEPFISFMLTTTRGIVPFGYDKDKLENEPNGCGAFSIEEFLPGEKIVLKANESYFEGRPNLDYAIFKVIENSTTRMLELKKGSVDLMLNSVPAYAVKFVERMEGIDVITEPGITFQYIGYNLTSPKLRDVRVREAVSHAIDRDEIIKFSLKGLAIKAGGMILAPSNWAYEPDVKKYGYNIEKAKKLLDEAGYKDPDGTGPRPRLHLTFKTSKSKEANEIAQIYRAQLQKVGIDLEVLSYEWGTFFGDVKSGNFEIYSLRWIGIVDPDIFYYVFHTASFPPAGANRNLYKNPIMDDLIEQSRREQDKKKRKELYSYIQRIAAEDIIYTPLWYVKNVVAINKKFKGFIIYPGGQYTSLKDVYIEK
ncbi:ABC transporter substrate-binding protein [Thermodesulfobacteriota bacterium]